MIISLTNVGFCHILIGWRNFTAYTAVITIISCDTVWRLAVARSCIGVLLSIRSVSIIRTLTIIDLLIIWMPKDFAVNLQLDRISRRLPKRNRRNAISCSNLYAYLTKSTHKRALFGLGQTETRLCHATTFQEAHDEENDGE